MKKKRWIIAVFGIFIAEMLFSTMCSTKRTVGENTSGILQTSLQTNTLKQDIASGNMTASASSHSKAKSKKIQKIYSKNKKILVLVNADNALEESYDASLRPICNGRLYASEKLYDSLTQMLADAAIEGYQFWIASAYRSREKQQRLVDEDVRRGMQQGLSYEEALRQTYEETMPAGHSEHETGLALDILCSGNMNMDSSQETEPGNIWLRENCYRYGFIPRYPKDKETITKVNYEPWHFRFVGERAAKYMREHNMTLEEFWENLSNSK